MTFASPVAELIRWVQQAQFEICQTAWLSSFGIFQGSMKTFLMVFAKGDSGNG